jgi:nitronate monooxygenase
MLNNELTNVLHMKYPIIQAPMAGGVTTSKLVAEVSNRGGLGNIGAGYMTPSQMSEQIREVKQLTSHFYGVNLFVPNEFTISENEIETARRVLQPIYEKLNITSEIVEIPNFCKIVETFNEQVKIVIEEKVPVCSFTFGIPSKEVIAELKRNHIILIGTATTVSEAIEIERSGIDMVVVQGCEAGGHRGHFASGVQDSLIGLMSLIPQVVDKVSIPVIAAGGIMDGRGLASSLCLGAKAVQMGTAFLTCEESGAHQVYKEAILHASEDQMVLTRAFSGKYARGIKNKFVETTQKEEMSLPDFPVQNTITQSIRKASSVQNNPGYMSLWSGQSPRLAKNQTVQSLIETTMFEATNLLGK